MQRFLRILIPVLILAVGYGAWKWIGRPEERPAPQRQEKVRIRTEVLELHRQDYPVILESQGVVRAHHLTQLTAQVPGRISEISPSFQDGAFFKEGEVLVILDPADYEAELISAEAALARAEASLAQEEARAKQAQLNWDDIGYDEEPSDLVLRVPQLKEARANVEAAAGGLEHARRNLERTRIRAPFDGRVKARNAGPGQAVGANTNLGEIFATDFAELRLPLSPAQLRFIDLPTTDADPAIEVTLRDALDPRPDAPVWKARIVRTEGTLDEASRELFTIARLDDPFGLTGQHPPLQIGQPMRGEIAGAVLENVIVLPRQSLRGVNTVYLVTPESTLDRTRIVPLWSNARDVVVKNGVEDGQFLVISRLPYAPDGAEVEVVSTTRTAPVDNRAHAVADPGNSGS